jgi:cytidylate kinase
MHTLITIGRQFGSGGGCVAQAVSRILGIPFYDNELISKAAEESGFSRDLFRERDERASLFSMSTFFESWRFGQPQNYMNDNTLFSIQSKVIRDVAERGDAIIIGRCADYILRDLPTLDVFVTAPIDYRIRRVMEREKMERDEAETLIRRKDRTRETYYNYFTFGSWGAADSYDLCIDSSILGIEGTAEAIVDFGKKAGRIAHA